MTRTLRPGLVLALVALAAAAPAQEKPLTRIAFGSCCDQEKPLPVEGLEEPAGGRGTEGEPLALGERRAPVTHPDDGDLILSHA